MSTWVQLGTERWRSSAVVVGMVPAAWVVLVAWAMSPYAEWLDHAEMAHMPAPASLRLIVFTFGWALMVVAMMLPATLLLLRRCAGDQTFAINRLGPVILAYLVVWIVFGSLAFWGDSLLHELVEQTPSIGRFIAPGVLLLAGAYQLTPMKWACLSRCRFEGAVLPLAQASPRRLWAIGLRHGLFCLGSCWSLMLLMFAAGGVNLVWMLVLGLLMTVERISSRGVYLARLAGMLMVVWSVASLMQGLQL
ncbi:MAG: DUF2182 domain-containing protein [Caldilineaceae bacterium]